MPSKEFLRQTEFSILKFLPEYRKKEASESLLKTLLPIIEKETLVLSFSSLGYEIDTSVLNEYLCSKNKLVISRVNKNHLDLFLVDNLTSLERSKFGIFEPKNDPLKKIYPDQLSLILVPGLLFDKNFYRLGHGYGYFDKLLKNCTCKTFGLGFKEQLSSSLLPIEPHDVALKKLFLF